MLFRTTVLLTFQSTCFPVSSSFQTRPRFNIGFGISIDASNYESMNRGCFTYRRASNHAEQSSEDDLMNRRTDANDRPLSGKERAAVELRNLKKSIADLGTKISSPIMEPESGASEPPLSTGSSSANGSKQSTSLSNSIYTLGSRLDTLTSKVSSRPVTAGTKDIISSQGGSSNSIPLSSYRQEQKSSDAPVATTSSISNTSTEKSAGASKPADSSNKVSTTSSYLDNLSPTPPSIVDGRLNASVMDQFFSEDIHSLPSDPFSSIPKKSISHGSDPKSSDQENIERTGSYSVENYATAFESNSNDQNSTDSSSDLIEYDTHSSDTGTMVDNMSSQSTATTNAPRAPPYSANFVQSIKRSMKNASENTTGNSQSFNPTTSLGNQLSTSSETSAKELLDKRSRAKEEEMGVGFRKVNNTHSDLESASSSRKNDKDTMNSSTSQMRLLQTSYPTSISSTSSYLDSLSPRQSSKNKNVSNISIQSVPDSVVGCLVLVIGFWISTQLLSFVWDILF